MACWQQFVDQSPLNSCEFSIS